MVRKSFFLVSHQIWAWYVEILWALILDQLLVYFKANDYSIPLSPKRIGVQSGLSFLALTRLVDQKQETLQITDKVLSNSKYFS